MSDEQENALSNVKSDLMASSPDAYITAQKDLRYPE